MIVKENIREPPRHIILSVMNIGCIHAKARNERKEDLSTYKEKHIFIHYTKGTPKKSFFFIIKINVPYRSTKKGTRIICQQDCTLTLTYYLSFHILFLCKLVYIKICCLFQLIYFRNFSLLMSSLYSLIYILILN